MKKFLILYCLVGTVQHLHAMGGALCGIVIPSFVGSYYVLSSSTSPKKKIGEWALLTVSNAVVGSLSSLVCYALIANPSDAISATMATSFALSSGITIAWVLEKTVQKAPQFSKTTKFEPEKL